MRTCELEADEPMSVIRAVQLQRAAQSSRHPVHFLKRPVLPGLSIPFINPISATSQRGSQFSNSFSFGTSSHSHSFPTCSHTHSSFPVHQQPSSLSLINTNHQPAFTIDGLIDFRHNHIHLPPKNISKTTDRINFLITVDDIQQPKRSFLANLHFPNRTR